MSYEVADTLRKALDVLRERGWTQGNFVDGAGRVCHDGALNIACGSEPQHYAWLYDGCGRERFHQANRILAEVEKEHWGSSGPGFNDAYDTTQDDVERAFEKAIARAEEMGL